MRELRLRDRLPDRKEISDRLLPAEESRLRYRIYIRLLLIVSLLPLGATLAISGLVFIPMMALDGAVLSVFVAAAMVSVGVTLVGAGYLWLTGPV